MLKTYFADAAMPLYQSLDQDQKRRFAILAKVGVHHQHWRNHHHHLGWRHRAQRDLQQGTQAQ